MHRIRYRGRIESVTSRLRKFLAHQVQAALQMNAIVGVAGVTNPEVVASIRDNATLNPVGVRDIRAADQRGTTTVAQVEALGIPIA
jgi:NH3-dependent NAD+ synthetase